MVPALEWDGTLVEWTASQAKASSQRRQGCVQHHTHCDGMLHRDRTLYRNCRSALEKGTAAGLCGRRTGGKARLRPDVLVDRLPDSRRGTRAAGFRRLHLGFALPGGHFSQGAEGPVSIHYVRVSPEAGVWHHSRNRSAYWTVSHHAETNTQGDGIQ